MSLMRLSSLLMTCIAGPLPMTEDYRNIESNIAQITEGSLHARFQPYYQIVKGCHIYPAFSGLGIQAIVRSIGSDAPCQNASHGSNTYSRAWFAPDGRIAIMYVNFYPKIRLDARIRAVDERNHAYYWDTYVIFLDGVKRLLPIACVLRSNEQWVRMPASDCANPYGDTVITISNDQMTMSDQKSQPSERKKLVIHGLLSALQADMFDQADWDWGTCYLQTGPFQQYMPDLYNWIILFP